VTDSDQQLEIEAPEELLADMPLPSDAKTFFLGGIFVLSMLTAAYVASEIVLPMIFAIMLNLLMQPALRALERLRAPRALGALLLILVVIATIVGLGAAISGPAQAWIAKLPEGIPRIQERLFSMPLSIHFEHFWRRPTILAPRARSEARPGLWMAERFCRASLPGREASPAGCSPP
jgi:predicted PurR-regulated permease PerM